MRRRKVVLFTVVPWLCICVAARDIHAQSKSELVDLVKAYRAQVSDMDVRSTYVQEILEEDPARPDQRPIPKIEEHLKQRGLLHFRDSVTWRYHFEDKKPHHTIGAYDGKKIMFFDVDNQSGHIAPPEERMRVVNWIYTFLRWPQQPTPAPVADLVQLIASDRTTILPEKETMYGMEMVVLEFGDWEKLWLDINHGGIIRKSETRQSPGGPLLWRSEVPELHEIGGIYLPAKLVRTRFASAKNPKELWNTPTGRFTITIPKETFKINCGLTQEDFQIAFPPGTRVYNAITDTEYTVGVPNPGADREP